LAVLTILAAGSLTLLAAITFEVHQPGGIGRVMQLVLVKLLEQLLKQAKGRAMSKVAELYEAVIAGNDDVVAKTGEASEAARVAAEKEQVRLDARTALEAAINNLGAELRAQAETSPLGRDRYLELWQGVFVSISPVLSGSSARAAA
jgi:hypothetical protein